MKRIAFTSAALLLLAFAPAPARAQDAKPAVAPTAVSPELMKARLRPPVKGTAYIEIIQAPAKTMGDEIASPLRIKNVSNGPIIGLKIDQYFYKGKQEISAGTERVRHPIAPGEIVDVVVKAPVKAGITGSQMMFSHANGAVKPTAVKKFTEEKK